MSAEPKIPRSRLEKHLNKFALSVLEPLGFLSNSGGCLRKIPDGEQYLAISVTDIGGQNDVMIFGATGLSMPYAISKSIFGDGGMAGQFQVDYPYFSGVPIKGRPCQTPTDLLETEGWLRAFLIKQMVPCLEKYSDPHAILKAYLDHDETRKNTIDVLAWHGWQSAAMGLIYASLYGPEHYGNLKQRYTPIFAPLLPEYRDQVAALLTQLEGDGETAPGDRSGAN